MLGWSVQRLFRAVSRSGRQKRLQDYLKRNHRFASGLSLRLLRGTARGLATCRTTTTTTLARSIFVPCPTALPRPILAPVAESRARARTRKPFGSVDRYGERSVCAYSRSQLGPQMIAQGTWTPHPFPHDASFQQASGALSKAAKHSSQLQSI